MHFIVLEGGDRFGKSTQVKLLVDHLVKCGFKARAFAFPDYGSATGKIIHDHLHGKIAVGHLTKDTHVCHCDPLVFQCVQTVDKYAAAGRILQALRDGVIVVCGRWWQSAYVYGSDDGLDEGWLHDAHECLPRADLNILLDCSPEEAASRTTVAGDRYERDLPKQRRLRDRYLGLWKSMAVGQPGWMVVPAWGAIEQVHAGIVAAVRSSLVKLDGLGNLHHDVLNSKWDIDDRMSEQLYAIQELLASADAERVAGEASSMEKDLADARTGGRRALIIEMIDKWENEPAQRFVRWLDERAGEVP